MRLAFTIHGRPVGKMRPRTFVQGGRAITMTPDRTRQWERLVAAQGTAALLDGSLKWPMNARYVLTVNAYHAFTKAGTERKTASDLDNVIKSVKDGLEGVAYENDRQVLGIVDSWTHHGAENERTEVVLETLG